MDGQKVLPCNEDIADIAAALQGQTVLVTGASGFIGARLIERLLLECDAKPRVFLRSYSRAARLARFDVDRFEIILGSLEDTSAIEKAVAGAAIVFHCAYDPGNPISNVKGAKAIVDACVKHRVRLVHVSTISVYEPLRDGNLDENCPTVRAGLPYSENKLDVEEIVLQAVCNRGLDAVVVMPTIVYGPFCKPWTLSPAKQISSGTVVLPENGEGFCNAVHVDDVCQGMLRAALTPHARGRKYFLSGAEVVTWGAFYKAFSDALHRPPPSVTSRAALERKNSGPFSAIKLLLGDPKRIIRWRITRAVAIWAKNNLSPAMKDSVKALYKAYRRVAPDPVYTPDTQQMALFSAKCRVSIARAHQELKYNPSVNFEQGSRAAAQWAKWALPD